MIGYLCRYYSLGLLLALLAPLWLRAAFGESEAFSAALRDAVIWTGVLVFCWILITKRRGFEIKGVWRVPTRQEMKLYGGILTGALLIDIGSKVLFFRYDRPHQIEIFKNFGLHSVFHETQFEAIHVVLLGYFIYVFVVGALFFRFSNRHLDQIWLASAPFALGGAFALFGERLLFGGVHDSLYFAGPLMWVCPLCASPRFASYAWTPADLFAQAALMPPFVLIASYLIQFRDRAVASVLGERSR